MKRDNDTPEPIRESMFFPTVQAQGAKEEDEVE